MTDSLVLSAGHQLRDRAGPLAEATVACEFGRHADLRQRFGANGRAKLRQGAVDQFSTLADAVDADSQALFNDHLGWNKALACPAMRSEDLERHLRCMADVVREQMPPQVAGRAVAMLDAARAELPAMGCTTNSLLVSGQPHAQLAQDYVNALLGGYRRAAGHLVFEALERGESVRSLYLQVLQPALWEVGRLWQVQKITVAQEHFCSVATQILMAQLLPRQTAAARRGRGVVIACVSGDLHEVGARMVGDFFEMAGWDTYFCGANTPHAAMVQSVVDRGAEVLAVSATMGRHVHAVQDLAELARADPRCSRVRILVGGHPFNVDPKLWRAVGADGTAPDADAAVALAESWLAGSAGHSSGPPAGPRVGPTRRTPRVTPP